MKLIPLTIILTICATLPCLAETSTLGVSLEKRSNEIRNATGSGNRPLRCLSRVRRNLHAQFSEGWRGGNTLGYYLTAAKVGIA